MVSVVAVAVLAAHSASVVYRDAATGHRATQLPPTHPRRHHQPNTPLSNNPNAMSRRGSAARVHEPQNKTREFTPELEKYDINFS